MCSAQVQGTVDKSAEAVLPLAVVSQEGSGSDSSGVMS